MAGDRAGVREHLLATTVLDELCQPLRDERLAQRAVPEPPLRAHLVSSQQDAGDAADLVEKPPHAAPGVEADAQGRELGVAPVASEPVLQPAESRLEL